jgi:hypothetical protein
MPTKAEALFEEFCTRRQIPFERIAEGSQRTPDYQVTLGGRPVAVEVKQLEPNADDLAFFEDLRTKGEAGGAVNMGRAKSAILDGVKQLRRVAKGRMPAIVLLYDTMGFARGYLDPYSLAYCLYGPEKVHYAVASDPAFDIPFLGMSRGGGSVATRDHNTTLSALAVLHPVGRDAGPDVFIYHNIHAAIPLADDQCVLHGIRHFRFAAPEEGKMPEWIECVD